MTTQEDQAMTTKTKTAHTPGPWHLHDSEQFTVCGPDHLAISLSDAVSRSKDENDANARLIAAAPDLLEGLDYAENELIRLRASVAQLKPIRAAIQKAKGGQ